MQRNVYIEGEMGELFGKQHYMNAPTVRDVFRLMQANHPNFRKYILDCHEKGVGFAIEAAGDELEQAEELLLPLHEGDIIITPVPEGSGGGFKKILLAIAIVTVIAVTGGFGGMGAFGQGVTFAGTGTTTALGSITITAGAGLNTLGLIAAGLSVSLALSGLMEMMAPDPSTDSDQEESYLFNGKQQNIIEGDPVPVLYGKLRVPGQPINFETSNKTRQTTGSGPFQQGRNGDTLVQQTQAEWERDIGQIFSGTT